MFGIRLREIYFGVNFSFCAVMFLIFSFAEDRYSLIIALLCCILHEIGHLTAMLLFSRKPGSIILYGGGIRIVPEYKGAAADNADIVILLAGCMANFLCAGAEILRAGLDMFAEINLLLGCFNLLPFGYFDGGRVMQMLVGGKALMVIRVTFTLLTAAFIFIMLTRRLLNISLAVTFFGVVLFELAGQKNDLDFEV